MICNADQGRPQADEVLGVDQLGPLAVQIPAKGLRDAGFVPLLVRMALFEGQPVDLIAIALLQTLGEPPRPLRRTRGKDLHLQASTSEGRGELGGVILDTRQLVRSESVDQETDAHERGSEPSGLSS